MKKHTSGATNETVERLTDERALNFILIIKIIFLKEKDLFKFIIVRWF